MWVGSLALLAPDQSPTSMHDSIHKEVVDSAYDVISKKGYTNWAVGLTGAFIGRAVLDDIRQVMPVSTCVRGMYGVEHDVFLSMPSVVGANGVSRVLNLPLTDLEQDKFLSSVDTLWGVQKDVWDKI
jgi:L-lactate dehydrogenase